MNQPNPLAALLQGLNNGPPDPAQAGMQAVLGQAPVNTQPAPIQAPTASIAPKPVVPPKIVDPAANRNGFASFTKETDPSKQVGGIPVDIVAEAQKAYAKEDAQASKDKRKAPQRAGEALKLNSGWANQ